MNNISRNIGLYGEYRITVNQNNTVIKDSGWCKNTILSSGLELLFSTSIPQCLQSLDLGTNSTDAGNYTLSGVITPSLNTELLGISSNNVQYHPLGNIQSYYATYSSPAASFQSETINEFCIKGQNNTIGFARNVLVQPIVVNIGQNINFEYRLSLTYNINAEVGNLAFKTPNDTFYLPISSCQYNLPNIDEQKPTEVGKIVDNYPLVLTQNSDSLPSFGDLYPSQYVYAVNKSPIQSTFTPTVVFSGLDPYNKSFTAITEYKNLSTPLNSGIFDNINSAILTYNDKGFHITRFDYPLALYNYKSIVTSISTTPDYEYNQNLLSLFYKYTWCEQAESVFSSPSAFSLSALQLVPCNVNLTLNLSSYESEYLTSNMFASPDSLGNDTRVRVYLPDINHAYNIQISCSAANVDATLYPYGPSPLRIITFNQAGNPLQDSGYVFNNFRDGTWPYMQQAINAVSYYNTQLKSANNSVITQSLPFTFNLEPIQPTAINEYIDVVINTPFTGVAWNATIADSSIVNPFGIITIIYSWLNMPDLDTGTEFLGNRVGYGYGTAPYMTWTGDQTADGNETITVDLAKAWEDGVISEMTDIICAADWFPPSSSGPATLTVIDSRFGTVFTDIITPGDVTPSITPVAYIRIAANNIPEVNLTSFVLQTITQILLSSVSNDINITPVALQTTTQILLSSVSADINIITIPLLETTQPITVALEYDGAIQSLPSLTTIYGITNLATSTVGAIYSTRLITTTVPITGITFTGNVN